ncbi:hypothetical protein GCM10027055_00010 [Janibacter alkaliphilus]|uniref:TY-Chap N-terminal domain-containing protein n=1 Tax=Janibacter alkaliphilus TaxID=1069963 RepID=A0A852XDT3_9MICO|nr:hypothetical protein [Janibacter alkaliphilus]NYG36621.1 hypothetical protein [Janibacter alkaliphilus]
MVLLVMSRGVIVVEWSEFQGALAGVLGEVGDRWRVIIREPTSGVVVQFADHPVGLEMQCSSREVPKFADLIPASADEVMEAQGWQAPTRELPLWSQVVELPALTSELEAAAGACVTALRDAFGVGSPDDLVYTAWREREVMMQGVTYTGEEVDELDPGEYPMPLPRLGLPLVAPPGME